jgi:hypothetical protein
MALELTASMPARSARACSAEGRGQRRAARQLSFTLHGARSCVTSLDRSGVGLQSIDVRICGVYTAVYTNGGSYGNRKTIQERP